MSAFGHGWNTDPEERELAKAGYISPFGAFGPDDRNLTVDGLRVRDEPCMACGVGNPIFETLLFEPNLPLCEIPVGTGLDRPSGSLIGAPFYWRCPECGHSDQVRLDHYRSR